MRKSCRLQQQSEERSNPRRSNRVRRSVAVFTPENANPITRCENNKRKHKSFQLPLTPSGHEKHKYLEVEHEQQELPLTPSGYELPLVETRDEIPVVELPSSPEEEKPKFDLLSLLEHSVKPNSREEVLPEDCQHLVNAASVLKSQLMARLTRSAENLRTEDMIDLANRCFRALRELGDDYQSFNKEVHKFIAKQQKLDVATKDLENWNDWDLRARYNHQVQLLSDVTEKLFSAQDKLSRTKSHVDSLKFKKDELTAALLMVTEELFNEEDKIKNLTVERDKCKEVQSDVEVGLKKLEAEKKEAFVALEPINARYNAAKEEFERMSNQLLQLVRRAPSNLVAEPSTTRFSAAELATAPSTVSPQPVYIGVSSENQAYGPAIVGVSYEMPSPSATQRSWCYDPSLNMFL